MDIPITGFLVLLISCVVLARREWLLSALVLSSPFSATAVINFPGSLNSISVPVFFSSLYVGMSLMHVNRVIKLLSDVRFSLALLFFILVVISFVYNFTSGVEGNGKYISELRYTQLGYLLLGIFVAFFVSQDIAKSELGDVVTRSIAYSVIFICLVGFLQVVCFIMDITYPSWIFNNSVNPTDQGYDTVMGGFKRISSASSEPSILALFLLSMIVVLIFSRGSVSRGKRHTALVFAILILLLSTSATAYVGLFLIVSLLPLFYCKNFLLKMGLLFGLFFIGMVVIVLSVPLIEMKLSSYSFSDRWSSILFGWNSFVQNPVFGNGWGAVTVYSMPVWMLANVGEIAFFSFFTLMFYVFYQAVFLNDSDSLSVQVNGYCMAFLVLLLLQSITGFSYVYSFFWIVFGSLMGFTRIGISQRYHYPGIYGM